MAQRDDRIDARCTVCGHITGAERGEDQRNRDDQQHPGIDDADLDTEIGTHDGPVGETDEKPERQPLKDRTVPTTQGVGEVDQRESYKFRPGLPIRYISPVGAGTPPAGSSVTATATGAAISGGVWKKAVAAPD